MKRILVVDDDNALRMVLCKTLVSSGYSVENASDGEKALKLLAEIPFDLMITDLSMPGMSGTELIEKSIAVRPDMGCLMITAFASVDKAVEAMKAGASDFITKPFSLIQLEERINQYFEISRLKTENVSLKQQLADVKAEGEFIGKSPAVRRTLELVDIVSVTDATVLIHGESGTGKELIAREIHLRSSRADKPFLKINCAAVPETLFESTLFGHEKGSFSGAIKDTRGIFEESNGGTLLLDEISEISPALQAKLLRVLQERVIQKVGTSTEIPVDVRIIATSNRNIQEMVTKQEFREDLFFRLNVFPISIPPLHERREDISLLAHHFVKQHAANYGVGIDGFSEAALDQLTAYQWPGNVRELQNLIERAVLLSGSAERIEESALIFPEMGESATSLPQIPKNEFNLDATEKRLIFQALAATRDHRSNAAELLGISIRTLRNKLNSYQAEETSECAAGEEQLR